MSPVLLEEIESAVVDDVGRGMGAIGACDIGGVADVCPELLFGLRENTVLPKVYGDVIVFIVETDQ